jgi:hypothetical protein
MFVTIKFRIFFFMSPDLKPELYKIFMFCMGGKIGILTPEGEDVHRLRVLERVP